MRAYRTAQWICRGGCIAFCYATLALAEPSLPRVMSINIANHSDAIGIAREIEEGAGGIPDVLLMQEVRRTKGARTSIAEDVGHVLGLQTVFAAPKPGPTSVGVAILSRWPLSDVKTYAVPRFYRLVKVRPRIVLSATAKSPAGPIRIWTTHLDTRITVEERVKQLCPILEEAGSFRGPAIIGGDLNTLSLGWILHSLPYPTGDAHSRAVADLMESHGFKTPFKHRQPTFDRFGMQLDWVFLRDLEAGRTGVEPLNFSDHHAVWTEFNTQTSHRK